MTQDTDKASEKWNLEKSVACPKCKIEWKGIMLYCCPRNDCPIQPKIT